MVASRLQEAQEQCWKRPIFFPDSLPFLEEAGRRGYRLYLATGDYAREKAESLEREGRKKYLEGAFDQSHLGVKGDASYFQKALELTRCRAEEATMAGDSLLHDIAAAQAVGLGTIWVNRRGEPLPADCPAPDHQVRDLREALKYLP